MIGVNKGKKIPHTGVIALGRATSFSWPSRTYDWVNAKKTESGSGLSGRPERNGVTDQ
jgi:hypothetical protein